ncbi:MAG: radical SAM protein [Deferribacterales bacterium]
MKERYAELNSSEFGRMYSFIPFLNEESAEAFEAERSELLSKLSGHVKWTHRNTKADASSLSNGCRLCGEGLWSCLFINGRCNCDCFYCPASQDEQCKPTTNAVTFDSPDEYVAYLREFGYRGASISGGEPLLTPELTVSYISAVKQAFGDEMYVWMYTNGTLVTPQIIEKLKNAGLNEIRFDIGATDYDLSKLKLAVGHIPVVTVEVPAVPEEYDRMKDTAKELADLGVKHLNLHQLRLTPYNFEKLIERDYHYISNESVLVAESELTALKLMLYTKENGIDLPVNYCSFAYKNRYQGYASRKRCIEHMIKDEEVMTENGYIRNLTVDDSGEKTVKYFSARQLNSVSYRNPFKNITLTEGKKIVIERFQVSPDMPEGSEESHRFEKFEEGLLRYR